MPDVLQSIGSHRVGHNWVTELIYEFSLTNSKYIYFYLFFLPSKIVILCTLNLCWFLPVCSFFPLNHVYVSLFISCLLEFIPDTSLRLKIVRGCLKRAIVIDRGLESAKSYMESVRIKDEWKCLLKNKPKNHIRIH